MPWAGAPPRRARQATAAPAERIHALSLEGSSSTRNLPALPLCKLREIRPLCSQHDCFMGRVVRDVLVDPTSISPSMAKQLGLPSNPQCQCPPGREHRDPWNQMMLGPQTKCSEQGHASGQPWSISVRGKDKDLTEATRTDSEVII